MIDDDIDDEVTAPHPGIVIDPTLPLIDALAAEARDDATWGWPDGHLHPEAPPAEARVPAVDMGTLPIFGGHGWFPVVEAPPCGSVIDYPSTMTPDGQRRRFSCDRPAGHPPERGLDDDQHRAVTCNLTETGGGKSTAWTDAVAAALVTGEGDRG